MLHLLCQFRRNLSRTGLYCGTCLIFVLIIVEALLRCDLDNWISFAIYNCNRKLPAFDVFLNNDFILIRIGTVNGILIFFLVVYNINTYTGTTATCFYNNRKFHAKILDISCTVFFQHGNTLGCRYLVHKKDLLGEALIHSKGTA